MKVNSLENVNNIRDFFEPIEVEKEIPPKKGGEAYFFIDTVKCRMCGDELSGCCFSGRGWFSEEYGSVGRKMEEHIKLHALLGHTTPNH